MYNYNYSEEYLMHYGIKGMKWGVRRNKAQLPISDTRKRFDSAKADYKSAKKAYNKSYNKAHNYSALHPIGQWANKKKSAEADRRWNDAIDKADKLNKAKSDYKQAKRERKQQLKDAYSKAYKESSLGDKITWNSATYKQASKYIVDNNMTVKEANERAQKGALRNTAVFLGAYGALSVASLYLDKK